MKPRIIAISGPTASGKTDISVRIAQHLNTEIISFDSRQFYRELKIGVARPTKIQLSAAPHHFIANRSILESYSAASFAAEARIKINELLETNDHVILCGGTGLYLKALLDGMSLLPETHAEIREEVDVVWNSTGIPGLLELIKRHDPDALSQIETQNPARLKRVAELLLSAQNQSLKEIYAPKMGSIGFSYQVFNLMPEKDVLYPRIDSRVDAMMEEGLLEEVKSVYAYRELPVLKTVGYAELFDCLDGKTTPVEAVNKIKQHTRNYAKRQITWFKNQTEGISLQPENATGEILDFLKNYKSEY
jgi:tRNA dimethylallyltransferase